MPVYTTAAKWISTDQQAWAEVHWLGTGLDNRQTYGWSLVREHGARVTSTAASRVRTGDANSDHIRSGEGDQPNAIEALSSLANFVSAFEEARRHDYPHSENRHLFPDVAGDFADMYAEEFWTDVNAVIDPE